MSTTSIIELQPSHLTLESLSIHDVDDSDLPPDTIIAQSLLADSEIPEGGYGWVVVGACSVLTWWFVGTTYCWGIIQSALVKEGLSTPSILSFVGSLALALEAFFAILSARMIRRFGVRAAAVSGICFLSGGQILGGFCTKNLVALFATAGFTLGVGVSLLMMSVSTITPKYFNRKRGFVSGIVFAGGGLGGKIPAPG
jgi:MFS family permease